jgi:Flp pilus assembly protein TadG/Mg-chelatase subunit ChlD
MVKNELKQVPTSEARAVVRTMRRRRGVALIFTVAMFIAAVSIVGLAVDTSYVGVVSGQLQDGTDAAAFAAARQVLVDPAEARDAALTIASSNTAGGGPILLDRNDSNAPGGDIVVGRWDRITNTFIATEDHPNAVRILARRTSSAPGGRVPLLFGSLFGVPGIEVSRSAVAEFGTRSVWDLVIVQDVTGSFNEEIADARSADNAVLDCARFNTDARSRISLVTFTGFSDVRTFLEPLDNDTLPSIIEGLESCTTDESLQCTGTNISAGLQAALDVFAAPDAEGAPNRAIILVSDGRPETSETRVPQIQTAVLRQMAIDSADRVEEAGISLFTVLYNQSNVAAEADFLASLVRGDGAAFDTPDATLLPELISRVCALLPRTPALVE